MSDTAREREFYKYFNPYRLKSDTSSVAHSSYDTALTAFAQLGALRLDSKRCMISLFDRSHQYIIAEATRTLSLQSDEVHARGDALWLGVTVVPKDSGVCKLVVDLPMVQSGFGGTANSNGACIIPDLSKDERFKDKDFVTQEPFARFYAGVPILSCKGASIGSYCVLDDKPRETIDDAALRFLKDMAVTVMSHLELARSREEHRRGERMVRGLGSFVEGKSTIRNWRASVVNGDRSYEPSRTVLGGEGQLNEQQQNIQRRQDEIVVSLDRVRDGGSVSQFAVSSHTTRSSRVRPDDTWPPLNSRYTTPASSPSRSPAPADPSSMPRVLRPSSPDLQEDILSMNVKKTFSRAANVIRESIEVEGAIFFDASINSFGGLVRDGQGPGESDTTDSPPTSSGGEDEKQSNSDSDRKNKRSASNEEVDKISGILGFSTSEISSINGDPGAKQHLTVPEKFLKGLLRRHPKGKIFHFDQDGVVSSGSSSEDNVERMLVAETAVTEENEAPASTDSRRRNQKRFSRHFEAETIIKIFPGARCVALVPLWDSHRERWFAGGVVWTNTPQRVFTTEGELSYLAAFGSTIMAEVARLDAVMADKSKTDLLGSISHELRSPLHGILGSVEMLEDSAVNAFQTNMVHTVETCGRTLLDTIDHLLDFAKINHFVESSKLNRKQHGPNHPRDLMSLNSVVDLDVITEEVIAAVSAGHDTQKRAGARSKITKTKSNQAGHTLNVHNFTYASDRHGRARSNTDDVSRPLGGVAVILDIDKSVNWSFNTQAGAWRRIVMNLFANALKYTDHGYIRISLKAKPIPTKRGAPKSKVILTITDSGKGMSKKYLQDGLFTPFAQEDRLSPGTGLGLSIIRQIISSLGGKIDVHSVQGKGTEITVLLPLTQGTASDGYVRRDDRDFTTMVQRTQGLNVCLLGFNNDHEQTDSVQTDFKPELNATRALKSSLESISRDWFGSTVFYKPEAGLRTDHIYLVVETPSNSSDFRSGKLFDQIPENYPGSDKMETPAVVGICRSTASAYALAGSSPIAIAARRQSLIVEYISQPCGPRKLAKALSLCFERRSLGFTPAPDVQEPPQCDSRPPSREDAYRLFDFPSVSSVGTGYRTDDSFSQFGTPRSPQPDPLSNLHFPSITDSLAVTSETVVSSTEPLVKESGPFMLVDDNQINLKILVAYMKKNNYLYYSTQNGQEAFDAYKISPESCKVILMDISMPVMDGLESTRLIRGFEHDHKLKPAYIILLTGLASASVQQEAFSSGANLFLTKPVRLKELGRILEQIE